MNRTSPTVHSYDLEGILYRRDDWMRTLPDYLPLTSMSIPGTHDSLATLCNRPSWRRSQNWNVLDQLLSGIRYIDIPLREKDGLLYVSGIDYVDGNASLPYEKEYKTPLSGWPNYAVDSCAVELAGFLQQNPSETLIVRIRRDPRDSLNREISESSFAEAFGKHLLGLKLEPYNCLERMFYKRKIISNGKPIESVPTLGMLRGKVLMLLDFKGAEVYAERGLLYNSAMLNTDKYRTDIPVRTAADMDTKWADVNRHLSRANSTMVISDNRLHITHLAGGGIRQFPPEVVAAGGGYGRATTDIRMNPNIRGNPVELANSVAVKNTRYRELTIKAKESHSLVGMNERLLHKLKDWKHNAGPKKTGIVVMDFPGKDLVDAIIQMNMR